MDCYVVSRGPPGAAPSSWPAQSKPTYTTGFARHLRGNVQTGFFPPENFSLPQEVFPRPQVKDLLAAAPGKTQRVLGLVFTLTRVGSSVIRAQ